MIEYLISRGCNVNDSGHINVFIRFIQVQHHHAMHKLLECGFRNIYKQDDVTCKTPLEVLVQLTENERKNSREFRKPLSMEMFIDFCQYIMRHSDEFGGECKVLKHIIDTTNATSTILGLQQNHPTRKHFIAITAKYQINIYSLVGNH